MAQPLDIRTLTRTGSVRLGINVAVLSDPAHVVERLVEIGEQIDHGGRRRCEWFDQYVHGEAGGNPARMTPIGRTPTYLGRVCCYEHMRKLERRAHELRLPHDTTCPGCQRVFRLTWNMLERR